MHSVGRRQAWRGVLVTYQSVAIHFCARPSCGARFTKPWQAPKKRYCSENCRKRHPEEIRSQQRHESGEIRPPWTRETIVDAIREFKRIYGRPPGAWDWNPAQARQYGHHEFSERFYADACWPHVNTVQDMFGTWNAGIAAAGFTPKRPGEHGRHYRNRVA